MSEMSENVMRDPLLETPVGADIPSEYFTDGVNNDIPESEINNSADAELDSILNDGGYSNMSEINDTSSNIDDIKQKYNLSDEETKIDDSEIPDPEVVKRNAQSTAKIITYAFANDVPRITKQFVKINKEKLLILAAKGEISLDGKYKIQEDVIVTAENLIDLYNEKCDTYLTIPPDIVEGIKESTTEMLSESGKGLPPHKRLMLYLGLGVYHLATTSLFLYQEKSDIINILKQNKIEDDNNKKNKTNVDTKNNRNDDNDIDLDSFREALKNEGNIKSDKIYSNNNKYNNANDDDYDDNDNDIENAFGNFEQKNNEEIIEDVKFEETNKNKDNKSNSNNKENKNKNKNKNIKIRQVKDKDIPANFDISSNESNDDDDNIKLDDFDNI